MKKNIDIKPITSKTLSDLIAMDLRSQHEDYYFVYRLIIDTGIYLNNLLDLKVRDLRGKSSIEVRSSKRYDNSRMAEISPKLKEELDVFFEGKGDNDPAFTGRYSGSRLQISVFKRILYNTSLKHGIEPPITASTLVRTYKYHEYLKNPSAALYFSKDESYESIREYFGLSYSDEKEEIKRGSVKETFYKENLMDTVKDRIDKVFREISRLTERPDTMDNDYYIKVMHYLDALDSLTEVFEKSTK